MPAYANSDGKHTVLSGREQVQDALRNAWLFGTAKLGDGNLGPNAYALTRLTAADETKIAVLIKKAAS